MKKKIALLMVCAMATGVMLSGCGSDSTSDSNSAAAEEDSVIDTETLLSATDYDITECVVLMDGYMNLTVELTSTYEVSDDEVQTYIESYLLPYYPVYNETDKSTVEDGDIVNIDYVGTLDGEEFDGGSAEGYNLTIGSGSFIDGFEDGLIGVTVGETVALELTFPETYGSTDLAGQDVVFTVTVNSIVEEATIGYDELTDDYVNDNFSAYGLTTVEELKDDIYSTLESSYESEKESAIQESVLEQLMEGCEVNAPDGLLEEKVETTIAQIKESAETYEMEYADFILTYYGYSDEDSFEAYVYEVLEESMIETLILEAIVADQGITISTSDFNYFVSYYVSYYGYDDEEAFYEVYGGEAYVKLSYAENQALSAVMDGATLVYAE